MQTLFHRHRRWPLIATGATLALLLLAGTLVATWPWTGHVLAATTPQHTQPEHASHPPCSTTPSQWTPVGHTWDLTVSFQEGSRAGQSERSLMTFARNGTLTATFPGATPADPPTLPPAIDGFWCMTGGNTFFYQFKDPIRQGNTMVAYIAVHIEAYLTSATTYEGVGFGVGYSATGSASQPLPGQYGRTLTTATATH